MIRTVIGVLVLAVGAVGAIQMVRRRWTFLGAPERRHPARMVATLVMAAVFFAGFTMIGVAFLATATRP